MLADGHQRRPDPPATSEGVAVPIIKHLMDDLVARYGPKEGKTVYYAMEAEGKPPFTKKGKFAPSKPTKPAKPGRKR